MHSTVPLSYLSSPTPTRSLATTRPKPAFNSWILFSFVGVVTMLVAINLWASFGPKAVIADRPTASLKPWQLASQTPNQGGGQTTLNQPQDYPTGLYQAYLAARQNEGGTAYETQPSTSGEFLSSNPDQHLTARFAVTEASIEGLKLELSRVGYADGNASDLELAQGVEPVAEGNRVTYQSASNLTQWYVNGPLGLEQGFTLAQPLVGSNNQGQPLEFELKLSGLKEARLNAKGDSLRISLSDGQELNYGQLYVYDASGKAFPAHFGLLALANGEYRLTIGVEEVSGASYPLTVDPLFGQTQVLSDTTTGAANDYFGTSVALSSDGNTALIGANGKTVGANTKQGAAYLFTRSGIGSPYAQSQVLTNTTGAAYDYFGTSVALSSDGNTALIGSPLRPVGANSQQGTAYLFTRSGVGSSYSQTQVLSDTTTGAANDYFGNSVALSSDGNTALIGAYFKKVGNNYYQGAAYLFTRSGVGSPYTQTQVLSDTTTGASNDNFGTSVALSSDGNTALIGATGKTVGANSQQGAAYLFTRSGVGFPYAQSQVLSDTTTGAADDNFGAPIALSSDGNTALIGSPLKKLGVNSNQGAAYLFTRSGVGSPYAQTQVLTDTSGAVYNYFGTSVALSSDGSTALIGADGKKVGANGQQGAAYLFTRSGVGSSYAQTQVLSDTTSGAVGDLFGTSVALSSEGQTALIGAYPKMVGANNGQGAAYIFKVLQPSSVGLSANASTTSYGQSVSFTATVTPITATGTITFNFDNTTAVTQTLAGGSTSYVTSTLSVRQHTVIATYSGDSNFQGSTSSTVTVTVTADPPSAITPVSGSGQNTTISTTFSVPLVALVTDAGSNPLTSQTVIFTATTTGPSGTFADGSAIYMGTTDASGRVTTTVFTANSLVGSYTVTATVAGVVTPALFQLTNLAACDPLQVTSTLDNGNCGTLRQAVIAASNSPTKTVTINLAAGSVISLTSGLTLTSGIAITTTASCGSGPVAGPAITIAGSGVSSGDGLTLAFNNTLYGVWVKGFSGRQLVAPAGSHTIMGCVRASKA